ncbi:hypothetical protein ES702_05317 [subsurface metagenome]
MRVIKEILKDWPKRLNSEPILTTSNDAVFYAQVAYRNPDAVNTLKEWREKAHKDLLNERSKIHPNLDRLMQYALKAQFFRESFMEILRIQDEEAKQ